MPIPPFIIAGGVIYMGYKAAVQQFEASKPPKDKRNTWLTRLNRFATNADNRCQQFFAEQIDPLLEGKEQQMLMRQLNGGQPAEQSQEEKENNRSLALAMTSSGLAIIASFTTPALLTAAAFLGLWVLWPIMRKAYFDFKNDGQIQVETILTIYLVGFWLLGYYAIAPFVQGLYYFGVKLSHQMERNSRTRLTNLFGQQPKEVWKHIDGIELKVPLKSLKAGDLVVVSAGEPVPVDGKVNRGSALVDQQALTGESVPVEKEVGSSVYASTLLVRGRLFIEVLQTGKGTLSGQITDLLERTANFRSGPELKAIQLANQSVLPNLALGYLAAPIVGPAGAVAVLATCPAYGLRTVSQLSLMNYLSIASRHKILIKDASALESLSKVTTFVFDKTGTLTLEQPLLAEIHVLTPALGEDELLTLASSAEQRQPHPVARAIRQAAEARGLPTLPADEPDYALGMGIKATVGGKLVRLGSTRFMESEGLTIPDHFETQIARCKREAHSLIFVGIGPQLAGALEMHTAVRPEAQSLIARLKARGYRTAIISGDEIAPTSRLAHQLGVDEYHAGVLPQEKADLIRQMQAEGQKTCFVGDGVNDAVALQQADVSISILGATSVAVDVAQIILMDKNLNRLDELITISAKYGRTFRQGVATTLAPSILCIGGVFFAGFGVVAAEVLFQIGFFSGLAVATLPLIKSKKSQTAETKPLVINK